MSGLNASEKLIRFNLNARHTYEGRKRLKILFNLRKYWKQMKGVDQDV